jgi:amidohydrolase
MFSGRASPAAFSGEQKMRPTITLIVVLFLSAASVRAESPADWTKQNLDSLVTLYRDFHQHPELSLEETQTAAKLAAAWKAAGLEVTTGVGGHGVVGVAKNGPGPTLMIRTDLDALPVVEQTGLVYASKAKAKDKDGNEVGVMHACGHDIHITSIIGVARYLMANKKLWSGTLILIGQPAEERGLGAKAMLKDGLFEKFSKPDYAVALHCDPDLATGKVGYRAGYTLANVDSIDVTLKGRGGHGAYPHTTIDPIVMAAHFILDLQSLVSRENKPIEPAVVTVGSIHGGTKHNVISDSCHLQLTVRSYAPEVRNRLIDGIKRKASAAAASAGAPEPEVIVSEESTTPSVYNDDKLTARLKSAFEQTLGAQNVVSSEPEMGGEDFSRYGLAGVPICMFRLGTIEPKRLTGLTRGGMQPPSLHSPLYYPDPAETLATGVTTMSAVALDLLAPKSQAGNQKSK